MIPACKLPASACPGALPPTSGSPLRVPTHRLILTWHFEPQRLARWTLVPSDDCAPFAAATGQAAAPPVASRDRRDGRGSRLAS